MLYRPGPFPCTRCGHRSDMHETFNGLRHCRVCNYVAYRFPCSTARLQDERVLNGLSFTIDKDPDLPS